MKKVLVILAIVAMCGSIAQADTGSCTAGSMVVNFSSASFVTGLGWSAGGSRTITYSGSCNGCNVGPIIYGWGTNPLVEYYIGRGGGSSAGSYSTSSGTFTLYTNSCNGPNITGSGAFSQYNCSGSGSSGQAMGDHYNGWRNLGRGTTEGGGYCVVMAESWSSGSGSASISVPNSSFYTHWVGSGNATFTCGGGSGTTTTSGSSTTTSGTTGNFQAESYTSQSGATTVSGDGGTAVEYSSSSSYTAYNVNFGSTGPSSISVRAYYSGSGLQIRFYLDSQNGTNFCTVYQSGSGGWFTASNSCYPVPTGTHTVYVKVSAAYGQINWFDIPGATSGGSTTTTSASSTSTTTTASSTSTTTTASSTSTTTTSASSTSTTSSGSKTIVVRARGVAGSESVNVTVGGSTVVTWTLTTTMTNRTATTSNSGACNVQFTNDSSGRDVQVDYITVNGSTRQAESQATNTGVWQNSKCGGSNSEWLHCNGYIGFGNV